MNINDIRQCVQAYIPYDKGFMYKNGTRFSEDDTKWTIIYDGNAVPYIPYQEYGFTHYKTKKKVEVNKHFIQKDTVNAIDYLLNTADSGQYSRITAFNKRTVQARENQLSQGVLSSLKGNKTR